MAEIETTKMAEEKPQVPVSSSRAKLALRRKTVFSFAIVGAILGYASYLINVPVYSLALMIIVGVVLTTVVGKALKPVALGGKRWWSSPVAVYFFMWLLIWTILFNMYVVKP